MISKPNHQINYLTNESQQELLKELSDEIDKDYGWKEIKGGFIGEYFENTSNSKLKILSRYEKYFEAVGFKYNEKIMNNFFLQAKLKDYKAHGYQLKGITFIYATYQPNLAQEMKQSAGALSKLLMPELKEIKKTIQELNPIKTKPLEIVLLIFPKQ